MKDLKEAVVISRFKPSINQIQDTIEPPIPVADTLSSSSATDQHVPAQIPAATPLPPLQPLQSTHTPNQLESSITPLHQTEKPIPMFEPAPPIEPFYPTFEAEIEFSFEENYLTSLQTATNRLISVYLTDESPTNTKPQHLLIC